MWSLPLPALMVSSLIWMAPLRAYPPALDQSVAALAARFAETPHDSAVAAALE